MPKFNRRNFSYFGSIVVLIVLLFVFVVPASAAAPQYMYKTNNTSTYHSTEAAACEAGAAVIKAYLLTIWKTGSVMTTNCSFTSGFWEYYASGTTADGTAVRSPESGSTTMNMQRATLCADGSAPNTSNPLASQCADPAPTCTAGQSVTKTFFDGTGPVGSSSPNKDIAPLPTSDGQCQVVYYKMEGCFSNVNADGKTKNFYCTYTGKQTGEASPAGAQQPSDVTRQSTDQNADTAFNPASGQGCPSGTTNVGVDSSGTSICAGSGTSSNTVPKVEIKEPTQTVTSSDGSTVQTDITHRTNSDGSVTTTTTKKTIGSDGKVTTEISSVTGDKPASNGGGSGTNDKADEESDTDAPVERKGDLYAKKSKTFANVLSDFSSAVDQAPFVSAAKGFLSVTVSGASCPTWSAQVPYLNTTISTGDIFCNSSALMMYSVISIGLMIGAAYMAFRMAFL